MEEMTRKQPDVDRVTKTYKRKNVEPAHTPFIEKSRSGSSRFLVSCIGVFHSGCWKMSTSQVPVSKLILGAPGWRSQ